MSVGVFTLSHRFQFVEKTAAEVGADTIYSSNSVSVAQIEELFFRARKTEFSAGSCRLDGTYNDGVSDVSGFYEIRFTEYASPTALIEAGGGAGFVDFSTPSLTAYFSQRSYSMIQDVGRPDALDDFSSYFEADYTVTDTFYTEGDLVVNELNVERGMWIPGSSDYVFGFLMETVAPPDGGYYAWADYTAGFTGSYYDAAYDLSRSGGYNISPFREVTTAFSSRLYSQSYDYGGFYGFTSKALLGIGLEFVGDTDVALSFSKQVAWVDTDGSGNPFSAGNDRYLPIWFRLNTDEAGLTFQSGLGFHLNSESIPESSPCDLEIVTSSGSIRVPLFFKPDFGYLDSVTESGEDFVIEITEWWPYAKDSPAVPVWDSATGVKL